MSRETDLSPVAGAEAISLVTRLTRELVADGTTRARVRALGDPVSLRATARRMIDLPEDFRDLLVELHDAGAEFVVVGGHAVAFHGHPRATKDLDVLVRATPANATRVYRALAAFGAPLHTFEVAEEDFASYDGVLQIGLPPRRIDVLNRADGITFDDAVADGERFELDGRAIPVIGREALLRNKRAAGREQDLADVAALEALVRG
ncbi:MAG: nucleotidyltransferase [Sandaracinaceae bacterium]|nr:nucleotidyltransferase [Sandaracinaceae bacterium]